MLTKLPNRQVLLLFFFCLPILLNGQVDKSFSIEDYDNFPQWFQDVQNVRFSSPDSAVRLYERSYEYFLSKKDYSSAVSSLVELAIVYGHQAQYQMAYDNLWKALLLADNNNDEYAKMIAYLYLGRYYSFYKREEQSLQYFAKALKICKKMVAQNYATENDLVNYYYAFVSTYRELNIPEEGKKYLDSCYIYLNTTDKSFSNYLDFELSFIKKTEGKYQEALDILKRVQPWFQKYAPGYQTLVFTYMGDLFIELNEPSKGEDYYKKALTISEQFKSHLDFTPVIYDRLSTFYLNNEDYEKAVDNLRKERVLDELFFDSRSKNNASLLEIKDDFRAEKDKQQKLLQEKRVAQLEHEKKVKILQTILLISSIVFILFVGLIYFKSVRNKHKAEKELMKNRREFEVKQRELEIQKQELEIQQSKELLELKNKELAASSLKLIEKDEILATLKKRLSEGKGDLKAAELKKIVRTISISNAQNWEEFETRFISVNHDFITNLNKNYPKLTQGDIKLCSLIKLNLSSKEMAKLLGISVQSVHTNRYRLRKKLGLEKEVSLTEFISTI